MAKRGFSHSEMEAYQDCPMKWWFKYVERLQKPKPDNKLMFGGLIHEALDKYYKLKKKIGYEETGAMAIAIDGFITKCDEIIKTEEDDERKEDMSEHRDLGIVMLTSYQKFAAANDNFKVLQSELHETVPIATPSGRQSTVFEYKFKCDQIIEWNGNFWIHEFKTAASIGSSYIDGLVLDEQATRYAFGVEKKHDIKIAGILYSILRKKIPSVPTILAKGGLSKNKSIDTTYEIYLQAIKDNGLDIKDYLDILEILEQKGNSFIVRVPVMRNEKEKQDCENRLWILCKALNTDTPIYKCPSKECMWKCDYRPLCIEDSPEARTAYEVRERYIPEEEKEETQGGES